MIGSGFNPFIILFQWWPALRYLPFINNAFNEFKETILKFTDFHERQINEHLKSINSPPTDFVEAFLLEKQQRDEIGKPHDFT